MSESQQSLQPSCNGSKYARPQWTQVIKQIGHESEAQELLQVVYFMEEILFVRWQKHPDDDEGNAMKVIAEDLFAIKIHELGWPDPCQ